MAKKVLLVDDDQNAVKYLSAVLSDHGYETAAAHDGTKVQGPARIIENWKVDLKLKICKECGEAFAPEGQLVYFSNEAGLPKDFYDICRHCRT